MQAHELLPDHQDAGNFDGVIVRKGTVGAFLRNARVWGEHAADASVRANAAADIVEALPALCAIGLFEVLEVRDPELRALIDANLFREVRA